MRETGEQRQSKKHGEEGKEKKHNKNCNGKKEVKVDIVRNVLLRLSHGTVTITWMC